MCFSRSSARARSAAPIIARRRRSVDANLATVWFSHPIRAGTLLGTPQRNVHGALLNPRAQLRCRTRPIRKALASLSAYRDSVFSLNDRMWHGKFLAARRRAFRAGRVSTFPDPAMTDVSVDILEGKDAYPADLSMSCKQAVTIARAGGAAPVRALRRAHHHRGPHYVDHLSDLMLRLKQQLGLTSIVVTHDLDLMYKVADQVMFLFEGRVIFFGSPVELAKSDHPHVREFLEMDRVA